MKICLISFRFDSNNQDITENYIEWLVGAVRKQEARDGYLPDLILSAGYTCVDMGGLALLEREFGEKPISLAVEVLNPAHNPLIGPPDHKNGGQLYVIGRGKTIRLDPRQQFSSTGTITVQGAEKVVEGLAPDGHRRFTVKSKQVGWIECGEINLLCCQRDNHQNSVRVRYEALEQSFFEALTSLDIILNPQHTRMSRLHLLHRKIEALSSGKIIRAPIRQSWPIYIGATNWNCARQRRSQSNLQCVMQNGRRLESTYSTETENYIASMFTVDIGQTSF